MNLASLPRLSLPRWWFALVLALLVAVGGWLRLHDIEKKSLWSDELFTLAMAQYYPLLPEPGQPWFRPISIYQIGDGDSFLTAKAAEQSPPLQDLLEKLTIQFLGPTELGARLPAAVAGCALLLWFAWFAARRPEPQLRRILGWSLFLIAFSPALVAYAKDGRAYSLGAALIGMAGLLWMLRWRQGWRHWQAPGWAEIALFTLACYAHYNAAALVALLLLPDAVLALKTRNRQALLRLFVLGAAFLCWVGVNAHTILFTAGGGVAWGKFSPTEFATATATGALSILHPSWMLVFLTLSWSLLAWRLCRGPAVAISEQGVAIFFLLSITVVYVALAGKIASKAGMMHPRYYIFALPFVMVAFAIVLAELRRTWLMALAAVLLAVLAARDLRHPTLILREDFRQMAQTAVQDAGPDTLFLYPWAPNRNTYRVYLERFLGQDIRPRLVAISFPEETAKVCEQLRAASHVVALGHNAGRPRIDEVYATCGVHWPSRQRREFQDTFTEHWRK